MQTNGSWTLVGLVLLLSGCSSFQQSPRERGVAFELPDCTIPNSSLPGTSNLDLAASTLVKLGTLTFDKSWVCVTPVAQQTDTSGAGAATAGTTATSQLAEKPVDKLLRETLEKPFLRKKEGRPMLGLALSGGGTKAAAVATGVMAGLADHELLDSADFISSVSGGGYASYFYYAHRLRPSPLPGEKTVKSEDIYRDCVHLAPEDIAMDTVRRRIRKVGACSPGFLRVREGYEEGDPMNNSYQAFLKCQQDVFRPGNCAIKPGLGDFSIGPHVVLGTALAVVPALISSSLFDWGYTVSPAAQTYKRGIGMAYGSTLTDLKLLKEAEAKGEYRVPCEKTEGGYALNCQNNLYEPETNALTFDELRAGTLRTGANPALPFWIINASAPKGRNASSWMSIGPREVTNRDMFEMTAVSHGSVRYGYVSAPPSLHNRMNVLQSVTASAAFLDSNQRAISGVTGAAAGLALHLLALDWGQDIANYNVSDARKTLHRLMPLPFVFADSMYAAGQEAAIANEDIADRTRSAFIRLIDGGNAENLGVYALLRRKVKNIVISDAAQDTDGRFDDVCGLARRVAEASGTGAGSARLFIPGLEGFDKHCENILQKDTLDEKGYDLHQWHFENPVLAGCLRSSAPSDPAQPCKGLKVDDGHLDTRLLVIKPAVSLTKFEAQRAVMPDDGKSRIKKCWLRGENLHKDRHVNPPKDRAAVAMDDGTINCDTAAYMAENWSSTDGNCQTFPQHSTAGMTANSNHRVFTAYRELARQHVHGISEILEKLTSDAESVDDFEALAIQQGKNPMKSQLNDSIAKTPTHRFQAPKVARTRAETYADCLALLSAKNKPTTSP